jgi:hypothetical protein
MNAYHPHGNDTTSTNNENNENGEEGYVGFVGLTPTYDAITNAYEVGNNMYGHSAGFQQYTHHQSYPFQYPFPPLFNTNSHGSSVLPMYGQTITSNNNNNKNSDNNAGPTTTTGPRSHPSTSSAYYGGTY